MGLVLVMLAYGGYWRRTEDGRGLLLFWQRRLALSSTEFRIQRAGLALLWLAVALRFAQAFWHW
ncbi:hypothetical protein A11A3_00275 [Alcanivorax hongdengensis A-11-3]|uniref:Uncharacterized protein n=1 Tax=Alcanivorax hongdengensis A-11-3 TaxID=1177179 RepID=L0WGD0_9GAMM|nr:hypothetical protein A11A3_00275 [Alcanivorax hongdengensis A-11-3]